MEGPPAGKQEASTGPHPSLETSLPPAQYVVSAASQSSQPCRSHPLSSPSSLYLQIPRFIPTDVQMTADDLKYRSWEGGRQGSVPRLRATVDAGGRSQTAARSREGSDLEAAFPLSPVLCAAGF